MLLQALREYAGRVAGQAQLPPAGYASVSVGYVIDLDPATDKASISALWTEGARRPGQRRFMPQTATKTSGILALPFFGNGQYVFGLIREKSNEARAGREHAAFVSQVSEYASAVARPEVQAIQRFYASGAYHALPLPDDAKPDDTFTFRVDGRWVVELPEVRARWQGRLGADQESTSSTQCLICGELQPPTRTIERKIKGIPGGQSAGTALISANAEAFESYGLREALMAPVCSACADAFTNALNLLLANEQSHVRFADSVFAFWTREAAAGFDPFALIDAASAEDVAALLRAVRGGRPSGAADANRFHAIALSAAGGRAVLREWIDVTLPEAQAALARWFERQRIVDAATGGDRYFSLRALAGATVLKLTDIPAPTTRALLRTAFTSAPAPRDLMTAAVRRTQAERRVTAPQAALIKLVLTSSDEAMEKGPDMSSLQADHPSRGYQCGRLMAVLESIQRAALPGVKAGITDRYFGSASSSPAMVFPRLIRGAQPHLARLERDRPAAQHALQRRLQDVLDQLPAATAFPRTLPLAEQGMFALGYYHQRADDWAQARAAEERRRSGTASAAEEAVIALDAEVED